MGAELPDPRTRFLAQERIYSDTERHREGKQFSDTRKYGGEDPQGRYSQAFSGKKRSKGTNQQQQQGTRP